VGKANTTGAAALAGCRGIMCVEGADAPMALSWPLYIR
jgi:hypothetical protein